MSIDPLQSTMPLGRAIHPASGKTASRASFENLLARLATEGSEAPVKDEEIAAELLRIEMMQNSLALTGESRGSDSVASPTLSAVLKGLARFAEIAPREAQAPPMLARPAEGTAQDSDTSAITRTASQFLGIPYLFGGESQEGIDCSSFVQQVFREHNIRLPRTAREQIKMGADVEPGDLKEGDLVFFRTYASYPSHVGIYLGNGKMMHASSHQGEVTVSDMNTDYFKARYLGARRVA
ncbi:C40 family peptidase [Geomonas sp. RF6]|uniref:C40 family peptidase n=1 Tax=Geomonas sp. RF6 TaxID=2897342 RepID=UPI001E4E0A4A|nr:C40 family peptidase [Geomonas sp. RF6]UFS72551.1 C40 family peptidase [Geomonas sp. RF6]